MKPGARGMRNRRLLATLCCSSLLNLASVVHGAEIAEADLTSLVRIEAQPKQLELHSKRDIANLLVTGYFADGRLADLTREAEITSTEPTVAEVEEGAVQPKTDGHCELKVRVAGHEVTAPVIIKGADHPSPVSFRTEAVAALTRQGCNSGACHGAPSGKGGFQLSLQAYDLAMDEKSLTRAEEGRRTNSIEPAQSLLLLKPTMAVPHRGGLKLRTTDYAYEILRQWIGEGCRIDGAEGSRCTALELLPASGTTLTHPYWRQQIVARARFDNGAVRDVTRLTKFSTSDDQIAAVSEDGVVTGHRRGQVAVMARYLDQLVSSQFTLVQNAPSFKWPDPPTNNYVDEAVYDKLRQLQYEPSALCEDSEFVRRVYLDVVGALPTIEEQESFLHDSPSDRRQNLIDRLVERPEYARFWALKWGDLLHLRKSEVAELGVFKFRQWLVDSFQKNMPFDQFARELLTSQGSTFDRPAANYFRACDDPVKAVETTAQVFLGSRIQCAKCHNHPFENWTQDNFYGLSAFFSRVSRKPGARFQEEIVYSARQGEVVQLRTGQTMKPWLPVDGVVETDDKQDRRAAFAEWLTKPGNPIFARVAVNRIWATVMGQGIVDPVDDFRQSNPPSNPTLLDKLADDFTKHGFDQKHILRTILNSRTYQLSSQATESNQEDSRFFSHAKMRLLSAEQLLDAICQVTQVAEIIPGLPAGTLARDIPSPDFNQPFLDAFGRPARSTSCACERVDRSTLAQVIELFNGSIINQKLANKQNLINHLLADGRTPQEVIEQLYRSAVCRSPSGAELKAAMDYLAAKGNVADGMKDVGWALLNTDEFLTQH
jgi:hypothetical protein